MNTSRKLGLVVTIASTAAACTSEALDKQRPLESTEGPTWKAVEIVAVRHDEKDPKSGEIRPVTRIVASDKVGLCARLAADDDIAEDEHAISVVITDEALFTEQKIARGTIAYASLLSKDQCAKGSPARGDGTLELSAADDQQVVGYVDLTYENGTRVKGRFEAKRCVTFETSRIDACPSP